jgi:hypothetical protein
MDYHHPPDSQERLVAGQYQEVPSSAVEGVEIENLTLEFNRDLSTRNTCLVGLGISWILSIVAIGIGGSYLHTAATVYGADVSLLVGHVNEIAAELIPLALTFVVTCISECLGFIHTAALRWSLQHENRLKFNSNLRLISGSHSSLPNTWYANLLYTVCLVLTYVSASQTFYSLPLGDDGEVYGVSSSPAAFTILGIALLIQCMVVTYAWWATDIPSWSSNPLNTIKACQSAGSLRRVGGRCMLGVEKAKEPPTPAYPRRTQSSPWSAHKDVRLITLFLWGLIPLCIIWTGIVYALIKKGSTDDLAVGGFTNIFTFIPDPKTSPFIRTEWDTHSQALATLQTLGISACIQFLITVGLHTAELQVNLARDEAFWRRMISSRGCRIADYDSIVAALKSWQYLVLFFSKTFIHWLYGMSVNVFTFPGSDVNNLVMRPAQIIYLTVGLCLLCIFVTFLALRRPKGPLPATFGHLQTMANIVDEWDDVLFWGHKGKGEVNHAGTSGRPLPDVHTNELYA